LVKGFIGHSLYPIVAVAAFTGARRGEILALRWADIDLDRRTISITRSIEQTKVHGRRVKGPKKAKHARTLEIDADLCELLRNERAKHKALIAGCAGTTVDLSLIKLPADALAFPAIGDDLTALRSPKAVSMMFRKKANGLGFKLRFHDLRGTHETILLDKGVPVHTVAARCGHDAGELLRTYARREPGRRMPTPRTLSER
jgi:integrase